MNDFRRQWEDTRADLTAAFEEVGASGWYILGRQVVDFEVSLAKLWGIPHAIGVASGLDALEISLRILGCQPGDLVLTTPLSAFATTLAILKIGAVPVFVDVEPSGLINLNQVREVLQSHPGIRYFVPVHLYGHCLDLDALGSLRDEFNLRIVEDCAQSIGAAWNGTPCGTIGQLAATSFYPTKNLGAIGDAGAILTANPEFAAQARHLRDYGQSSKYRHTEIGYNSRLDELQAALLNKALLPRLAHWTTRRREIAAQYRAAGLTPLPYPSQSNSVWHLYPTQVKDRPSAIAHLKSLGITTGEHYPIAIPDQPALLDRPHHVHGPLPNARHLAATELSLPIHPYLTDEEIHRVISAAQALQ